MKKQYYVIALVLIVAILVLIFNNRIFLKQEETNNIVIKDSENSENISSKNNLKNKENIRVAGTKDSLAQTDPNTIHFESILVDTHNDFIWKVFDKGAVFGERNSFTQSDLPKLREGGVDVQIFAVWIPVSKVRKSYAFTVSQIEKLKQIESENSNDLEFAKTYDDIIRITNAKKICGLIGIEGGTAIENDLDNINRFFEIGVRYIGLTWNNSNNISTSAKEQTAKGLQGGLTDFGIQVVKRMNEVGMFVDVSHLSETGFWDVIETTTSPIIASHSNCFSLNPHYRNLTDEQIQAIAKNDGYIGVNFYDEFLTRDGKKNGATLENVVEHIDHIKSLVGVDYIGLGADFDGGITPAAELYDATTYPVLTKRLMEKGYSVDDVKKILGLNFLRVFKKVCG